MKFKSKRHDQQQQQDQEQQHQNRHRPNVVVDVVVDDDDDDDSFDSDSSYESQAGHGGGHGHHTLDVPGRAGSTAYEAQRPPMPRNLSKIEEGDAGRKSEALKGTYITVETQDGTLQQLKVDLDESNFATSAPILKYLLSNGTAALHHHHHSHSHSHNQHHPEMGAGSSPSYIRRRGGSFFSMGRRLSQPFNESMSHHPISSHTIESGLKDSIINLEKFKDESPIITPGLIQNLRRNRKRIVAKGGQCNIELRNVPKKKRQFLKDLFTTAVDMEWRFTLLVFSSSFFLSWLVFGFIYWIIAVARNDLVEAHLPESEAQANGTWKPCILAIYDYTSCYLFSLETQHTIGYGTRQVTERCPEAIIFVSLQSVLGVIISSCMAGIVFAKLARPKNRQHTVIFSKNAIITMRNGDYYLLFRVGNIRKSHIIESHVTARLIHQRKVSKEGEVVKYVSETLKVTTETHFRKTERNFQEDNIDEEMSLEDRTFLLWPVNVIHRIDRDSPFYELGPKEILASRFEMVVSLEGIIESTGSSVQVRSSYLPNEILWGHRFSAIVSYKKTVGTYFIDFANLNAVYQDDTPRISKKILDQKRQLEAKRMAQLVKDISSNRLTVPKMVLTPPPMADGHYPQPLPMLENGLQKAQEWVESNATTPQENPMTTITITPDPEMAAGKNVFERDDAEDDVPTINFPPSSATSEKEMSIHQ